jgi:LmbE family N-acetylglucosaminyl deacetylase
MDHSSDQVPLDVIAVGAHPDDIEIACGGTLCKLVKQGYSVGIIDLTDGEPTPKSPGPHVRLEEARQAAAILGVQVRKILTFTNRRLFDSFETRVALAKEFRKHRPRVVLGFGEKTPLASPDHYQVGQITDAAVFYSRLSKWDEHFDGLPVHTIPTLAYFRLAFTSHQPLEGAGHFVVDISEEMETKLKAVACYQTQFPPEKAHVFDRIRAIDTHHGLLAGFKAGELFTCTRTPGTRDLVKFLQG